MNHSKHEEGNMTTPSDRNNADKANGQTTLQVNERIMCRSLFDIFINSQQGNYIDKKRAGQRDRAPSRIPTTQLKHVMRKSKKVISALRMHFHKSVNMSNFIDALNHLYNMKLSNPETPAILMGDFKVNLLEKTSEQQRLTTCLIREKGYTQLKKQFTTDYRTLIDQIYTNVPHLVQSSGVLESYCSDHKPVYISLTAAQ